LDKPLLLLELLDVLLDLSMHQRMSTMINSQILYLSLIQETTEFSLIQMLLPSLQEQPLLASLQLELLDNPFSPLAQLALLQLLV